MNWQKNEERPLVSYFVRSFWIYVSSLIFGTQSTVAIDLRDPKSVAMYSAESFIVDHNANEISVHLHVLDLDARGTYTLRIIPHYSDDGRTSSLYSVNVKEDDFRNRFEVLRFQQSGKCYNFSMLMNQMSYVMCGVAEIRLRCGHDTAVLICRSGQIFLDFNLKTR